jgi:hypothetical protein
LTDDDLKVQQFLTCNASDHRAGKKEYPSGDYTTVLHALLPKRPQNPVISKEEATKSGRFSEMHGKAKAIADIASGNRKLYDIVQRELKIIDIRAELSGADPVEEPEDVSPKGRQRKRRIKGPMEGGRKRSKGK